MRRLVIPKSPYRRGPAPNLTSRRAFASLSLSQVVVFGVGFVTAPLMARALGPEGRGLLAAITVPLSVAPWVFQFGTGMYALKEAARGRDLGVILGSVGAVLLGLGIAAALAGVGIAHAFAGGHDVVQRYLIIGFATMPAVLLLGLVGDILWGLERWREVASMRSLPTLAGAAGIVVLYAAGHLTVTSAAIATIGSTFFQVVGCWRARDVLVRPVFRRDVASESVRFGGRVWVGTLAQSTNGRLDQLLMITQVPARELGIYSLAVTISAAAGLLAAPFTFMAAPRSAGLDSAFAAQATRLSIIASLAGGVLVAVALPVAIPIVFTRSFDDAITPTLLLLVAGVFSAGSSALGSALTAADRPTSGTVAEIASLVVTVPGLLLLLPTMGADGAALVSIAAYGVAFAVLVGYGARRFEMAPSAFYLPHRDDLALLRRQLTRRGRPAPEQDAD